MLVYSSWIFVKTAKMGAVLQCKLGAPLDKGDFVPPNHFYNKTKVRLVPRSTLLVKTLRPYYEPEIKWLTALNSLRGGRCRGTIFSAIFFSRLAARTVLLIKCGSSYTSPHYWASFTALPLSSSLPSHHWRTPNDYQLCCYHHIPYQSCS